MTAVEGKMLGCDFYLLTMNSSVLYWSEKSLKQLRLTSRGVKSRIRERSQTTVLNMSQQGDTAVKTYNVVLSYINGNLVSRMGDRGFLSPRTAHPLGASLPPLMVVE